MADKSGIQVARETKQELELLKNDVEHLTAEVEWAELRKFRQANAVLEEKVNRLEKRADASDELLERVAVLESQQADAKKGEGRVGQAAVAVRVHLRRGDGDAAGDAGRPTGAVLGQEVTPTRRGAANARCRRR